MKRRRKYAILATAAAVQLHNAKHGTANRLGDTVAIAAPTARYGNAKKVKDDGHTFDSKREHARYLELKLLERAGEITLLEVHPRIRIVIAGVAIKLKSDGYPNGRQLTYVADFRYVDRKTGAVVWEDVKMQSGHRPEVYRLKRALVDAMGITITET